MKARRQLTGRQAGFARYYSITGNGVKSARLAGYRDGSGLRTTASRLLNDANVCKQVERLKKSALDDIRRQVSLQLRDAILASLESGLRCREGQRALRFCRRIGLFDHQASVTAEIAALEAKYNLPFEVIADVLFASDILDDYPPCQHI